MPKDTTKSGTKPDGSRKGSTPKTTQTTQTTQDAPTAQPDGSRKG